MTIIKPQENIQNDTSNNNNNNDYNNQQPIIIDTTNNNEVSTIAAAINNNNNNNNNNSNQTDGHTNQNNEDIETIYNTETQHSPESTSETVTTAATTTNDLEQQGSTSQTTTNDTINHCATQNQQQQQQQQLEQDVVVATVELTASDYLPNNVDASLSHPEVVATIAEIPHIITSTMNNYVDDDIERSPANNNNNNVATVDAIAQPISSPSQQLRPDFIGIQLYKITKNTPIGISLVSKTNSSNKSIILHQLNSDQLHEIVPSLWRQYSHLQPGDKLLRVNGMYVHGWTALQAVNQLRQSSGYVTLLFQTACNDNYYNNVDNISAYNATNKTATQRKSFTIIKRTPDDRLGIIFVRNEHGDLAIGEIRCGRILQVKECILRPGDIVEEINGQSTITTQIEPSVATQMVRSSPKVFTIQVKSPFARSTSDNRHYDASSSLPRDVDQYYPSTSPPRQLQQQQQQQSLSGSPNGIISTCTIYPQQPGYISVRVIKPTRETQLGIQLANHSNGNLLYISSIDDFGLFSSSSLLSASSSSSSSPVLQVGYRILSINGIQCHTQNANDAFTLLRQLVGSITIVAQNCHADSNPNYVLAHVMKPFPYSTTGVVVVCRDNQLRIKKIFHDSLFSDSVVNTNDIILFINDINMQEGLNHNDNMTNPTSAAQEAVQEITQSLQNVTLYVKHDYTTAVVVGGQQQQQQQQQQHGSSNDDVAHDVQGKSIRCRMILIGVFSMLIIVISSLLL